MSDATTDFLISTLTDLLQVVVWGGLAAGLLLVWRPRLARRITRIQAASIALIAAGLVVGTWSQGYTGSVGFGSWPALRSISTGGVMIAHRIDVESGVLLVAVTLAFLLTALPEGIAQLPEDLEKSPGSDVVRYVFLQVAVQFVLMADPVLQIACLPLMSLCCLCGRVCDPASTNAEIVAARRTFLFRTAGDGMMLLGIAVLALHGNFGGDVGAASGTLLCVGLLVRTASYPFFSDDDSPHYDTLECAIIVPAGIVVLLPLWPAFAFVDVVAQGMLFGGVALALLAGGIAAARPHGGKTAIAIALTGLMLAGLGSGSADGRLGAVLLFASSAVLLPLLKADSSNIRQIGGLLLGLGGCGSAMIFAALISRPSTAFAGGVFVAAHALVTLALVRTWDNRTSSRRNLIGTIGLIGLSVFLVTAHANPPALSAHSLGHPFAPGESLPAHAFEYSAIAILGAIGLIAGWMLRQRGGATHPRPPGAFRRWLRAGCYLEEAFLLAVVLPLRGGAQLCRFCEWFIIERLWDLPRRAPAWLGRLGEPLRGGTVQMSVAAILLATAVLLAVIVGR